MKIKYINICLRKLNYHNDLDIQILANTRYEPSSTILQLHHNKIWVNKINCDTLNLIL